VLEGFEEAFEIWVAQESPNDALRLLVLDWLFTRLEDPFVGVRRQPSFENLWFRAGSWNGPRAGAGRRLLVLDLRIVPDDSL
jgi:hypothetical protein